MVYVWRTAFIVLENFIRKLLLYRVLMYSFFLLVLCSQKPLFLILRVTTYRLLDLLSLILCFLWLDLPRISVLKWWIALYFREWLGTVAFLKTGKLAKTNVAIWTLRRTAILTAIYPHYFYLFVNFAIVILLLFVLYWVGR